MAFDGNGNFVRLHNWTQDAANSIDINAGEMDGEDNGFATGLSLCVTRDGQGKMAADLTPAATGVYNLGTGARLWANIAALSAALGPPGSGNALLVTGLANVFAALIQGAGASGQSKGLGVLAGTTAADFCALFSNQGNTANFVGIDGLGNLYLSNGAGAGLLNAPVYTGAPVTTFGTSNPTINLLSANTTFKSTASGLSITIPANASIAFPSGTMLTFDNDGGGTMIIGITTDTLSLANTASTGNRSLAPNGICTAVKIAATKWRITGAGLS